MYRINQDIPEVKEEEQVWRLVEQLQRIEKEMEKVNGICYICQEYILLKYERLLQDTN